MAEIAARADSREWGYHARPGARVARTWPNPDALVGHGAVVHGVDHVRFLEQALEG